MQEMRSLLDEQYENPIGFMVGRGFGNHHTLKQFLDVIQDGPNSVFLF